MAEPVESGFKWWMRYVVVPLIGGGGIIAIIVALVSAQHPTKPVEPSASKPQPQVTEKTDLWLTYPDSEKPLRGHVTIGQKQEILIHWDLQEPKGKVKLVRTAPSQRHEWDVTGWVLLKRPVEMSFTGPEAVGEFSIEDDGIQVGPKLEVEMADR